MLSRFAVEIHTLPVHLGYSLDILRLNGCWGLPSYRSNKMRSRQISGIHPVHQEIFLHIHKLLRQLRILRNWIPLGRKLSKNQFTCLQPEKWNTRKRPRSEMPVRTVSQKFSHLQWRRLFKELWSRPTTSEDFGSLFWQVPNTSNLRLLENKIQDPRFVLVHNFLRKRCSGSKKWSWLIQWMIWDLRHLFVVFQCRILKYLTRGLFQRWTKSSIILTSKEESVWRNKRPRSSTVSFEADRLPTWSTNNSGSLVPMILSKTTPTCSLLLFEMTIFKNSILSGTEFRCLWRKSHLMNLGRIVQIKNTRVWKTQVRIGIVRPGDSSKEVRTWLSQIESYGEKKYRARNSK